MNDRLKFNSDNLEEIIHVLSRLRDDLDQVQHTLAGVDTSVSSIDDLRLKLSGKTLSFSEALHTVKLHLRQADDYVGQTCGAIRKSAESFEETEKEIRDGFDLNGRRLEIGYGNASDGHYTSESDLLTDSDGSARPQFAPIKPLIGSLPTLFPNGTPKIIEHIRVKSSSLFDIISKVRTYQREVGARIKKRNDYLEALEYRREHPSDNDARLLYDKYLKKITIADQNFAGLAHHNPDDNEIYYDWKDDSTNIRGVGYTYYHEVGHAIDDYMDMFGDASSSKAFTLALQSDLEARIRDIQTRKGCDQAEAYRYLDEWLKGIPPEYHNYDPSTIPPNDNEAACRRNGLSDLIDGLSGGQAVGHFYHERDYWNQATEHGLPDMINNEAFAHFFESGMNSDPQKLQDVKAFFPTAYQEYQKIIRKKL